MEEERINSSPLKKRFPGRSLLTPVPESPAPSYASVVDHQHQTPLLDTESVTTSSTGPKTPIERPSEPVPRMHDSSSRHTQIPEVIPMSPIMTITERLSKRISSVQKRNSMEIPRIASSDLQNQSVPRNRALSLDNPNPYNPIPNLRIVD